MRTIKNIQRALRLIDSAISDFELDMRGISVLTEAASGPFAVTPIIAAMAGADRVFCIGRNSNWGAYRDVVEHIQCLAKSAGCLSQIEFSDGCAVNYAKYANVVTNLGFVRPLNADFIKRLPSDSAIALMWEPWEYRPGEVDIDACRACNVPILGTNEGHHRLQTFRYLGHVALRLLFEREVEVERSELLLIASNPFAAPIEKTLRAAGANVTRIDPSEELRWAEMAEVLLGQIKIDAIVLAEHRSEDVIIGKGGISSDILTANGTELIHICGLVDGDELLRMRINKHPLRPVPAKVMTVTTDYIGPRPVIDLHAAGLSIATDLVKQMRQGRDEAVARRNVVSAGLGMDFEAKESTSLSIQNRTLEL